MARSVKEYPAAIKAQCVAAVLAGGGIQETARRYGVSVYSVSHWVQVAREGATDRHLRRAGLVTPDPVFLENLIFELVAQQIATIRAQLQASARPDWLARQTAGELAHLLVAERDTLIRLLAGFRPVDPPEFSDNDAGAQSRVDSFAAPDTAAGGVGRMADSGGAGNGQDQSGR
jgi:transposase-like protein